ncbi:hypothetical protein TorRG33x02_087610 [Trema orientale]|uniref:Uncharacterized protein n=1 Tax=Trema orientale TaxID=63057 RepID=A0A2P5FBS3_TREOI|nr:hypothetical protein TorRG33x02_087610 [Trema orientale]
MRKLFASARVLVLMIIVIRTNLVLASSRISFIPEDREPFRYVTGATTIAIQLVAIVILRNSHHFVCNAVAKIPD